MILSKGQVSIFHLTSIKLRKWENKRGKTREKPEFLRSLILAAASHHFCHNLLLEANQYVQLTLKGRKLYKEMSTGSGYHWESSWKVLYPIHLGTRRSLFTLNCLHLCKADWYNYFKTADFLCIKFYNLLDKSNTLKSLISYWAESYRARKKYC